MNPFPLTRRLGVIAAMVASSTLQAQAPAGGRGGAPALNPAQTAALTAAVVPPALSTAATTASQELARASLGGNPAYIRAAAGKLAEAELALALARADELAKANALLKPITSAQAQTALGRAGGGGRGGAVVPDNADGFTALFDGKTLNGWDGDPMFWSVKEGNLHAESTPDKVVGRDIPGNTFLIWKGGTLKDFELKVDYRFIQSGTSGASAAATNTGNSGIQFRARMSGPQGGAERPWGISGYQFDMVPAGGTGSGVFYTEGGGFGLTPQGTVMRASETAERSVAMRQIGTMGTGVADAIKPSPDWNTYHIIAHGNVMIGLINNRVTNVLVDDNRSGPQYALEGLLALQMHAGQPFAIEFRNVLLKEIKPETLTPTPLPAGAGRGGRGGQ
jgi:hypothetical protein